LHHIIKIPLLDLFLLYYLFLAYDHRVESELLENFQDLNFEDIEQQQAGFEGKCP
jgi:hypothetical protein